MNFQKVVETLSLEKFEVVLARHSCSPQVVLDDEYWNSGVFRNHNWSDDTRLRENHVITFGANAAKPIGFENLGELFIGDGTKLWHV
jgi:hypothetical protein